MKRVELSEFSFTRSFVFFVRKKRLKSRSLRRVLKQIKKDIALENPAPLIVRYKLALGTLPPTYANVSLVLGETVRSPTFSNGTLYERVIAYTLLLETKDYAALQLRHVGIGDIEPLLEYYKFAPYSQVTSVLSDKANILKIVSRIINPAQSGLTGRAYEGNSLQNEMPQFGSGKTIPRSLKANDNGDMISVTANSSRITTYGQAVDLDGIGKWFFKICGLLSANQRSSFLARFAEPIDFSTAMPNLSTQLIVFDTLALQRRIEEDGLVWRRRFKRKGQRLLSRPMATSQMVDQAVAQLAKNSVITGGSFHLGTVTLTASKLKIQLPGLKHFSLFDGKKDISLSSYINSKDLFSIYFDVPDHVYMGGVLFRDSGLLGEVDSVIATLEGIIALNAADREKVDYSKSRPHPAKNLLTNFPPTSVFAIAEQHFNAAEYIFCDDLGDEWADHIVIDSVERKLTFIHSKHGDPTTGASSLHEVVGQALKNMGNLLCMPSAMARKIPRFARDYSDTQISLVRKAPLGQAIAAVEAAVIHILSDNELRREAVLCCSFLSASQIQKELQSLRRNLKVRPHIRQLLWLLSYFVAACKELNVIPRILCRP